MRRTLFLSCLLWSFAAPLWAADKPDPLPPEKPGEVKTLDVAAFDKALAGQRVIVLDVRSAQEFAAGRVPGATNIPISGPGGENFEKAVTALKKDAEIIVYCRSGVRAAKAIDVMKKAGFTNLSVFPGGWVAWEQAGKPSEKGQPK